MLHMTADGMSAPSKYWLVGVVSAWCLVTGINSFAPGALPPVPSFIVPILLIVAFSVLHGARHYGWKGIGIFFLLGVVISNAYEMTSIRTGFPFGFYRHAEWVNPKLLGIPWYIGLLYFGLVYIGWQLAIAIVGADLHERSKIARFGLPVVATFITVGWDICFDPMATTFAGFAVYAGGGGYFGVPLSNYAGWFVTCWSICQAFALLWQPSGRSPADPIDRFAPPVFWALFAVQIFLIYLTANGSIDARDAGGRLWHFVDMLDTVAMLAAYTMLFAATASALAAARRRELSRPY
jgi:putative membrane protein